jgi:hypothetical protein
LSLPPEPAREHGLVAHAQSFYGALDADMEVSRDARLLYHYCSASVPSAFSGRMV